ncbi:IS3 family transposase [Myroides sp. LJL115]
MNVFIRKYRQNSFIRINISRKANCWDNSVAESFFKSFKTELIYGNLMLTNTQMETKVFLYIETWYNRKRRHSYLNYLTIEEFNQIMDYKKAA